MGNKINIEIENLSDIHYVIAKVENSLRMMLARQDRKSKKTRVNEAKKEED